MKASPWRHDADFLAFAEKTWPADHKLASKKGYKAQSAVTRMLHRWECFVALGESFTRPTPRPLKRNALD